jgi:hypothetical protein
VRNSVLRTSLSTLCGWPYEVFLVQKLVMPAFEAHFFPRNFFFNFCRTHVQMELAKEKLPVFAGFKQILGLLNIPVAI